MLCCNDVRPRCSSLNHVARTPVLPACVQVSLLLNAMVPSGFFGDPWFAHRGMCGMFLCIVVGLLQTRGLQAYNVAPMAQLVQDVALAIYPVTGSDDPVPLLSVDINAVATALAAPQPGLAANKLLFSADYVARAAVLLQDLVQPEVYAAGTTKADVIEGLLAARDCYLYQGHWTGTAPVGQVSLAWFCLRAFYNDSTHDSLKTIVLEILTRTHQVLPCFVPMLLWCEDSLSELVCHRPAAHRETPPPCLCGAGRPFPRWQERTGGRRRPSRPTRNTRAAPAMPQRGRRTLTIQMLTTSRLIQSEPYPRVTLYPHVIPCNSSTSVSALS